MHAARTCDTSKLSTKHKQMNPSVHNKLVAFIWSIADNCLRGPYTRGKYRDVILPMVVLRRLDALLERTKDAVMVELTCQKNELELTELVHSGLYAASGYQFYNTSNWTLQRLKDTATNSTQILKANFDEYLDGFSPNVKEILDKFKLKAQIHFMADKDILLGVLERFTAPNINLTPIEQKDPEGKKLPPLSNLGMGYVFEELLRKFNEENNEEAGEYFTPREVIDLMTHIVLEPVKDLLPPTITIYDPACGTGGMLTEAQNLIAEHYPKCDIVVYGKERNDETYAICKADMLIKENDPMYIRLGSTIATDEFRGEKFHFMFTNPPYGTAWGDEQKYVKDGKDIIDPRFEVTLNNYWQQAEKNPATPRTSDGQLLFLMEMINKMKPTHISPFGSRIASVHNGSSLFTGDAGSGESNIRRYILENDLLDCIIQLPNNLFYNTGITTYVWILSNQKEHQRKGKVLLIDASQQFAKLRKNLGNKNCELSPQHIKTIQKAYNQFQNIERTNPNDICAKVFLNTDFSYYSVTIDRPARTVAQFTPENIASLRFEKSIQYPMQWAYETFGNKVYTNLPAIAAEIIDWCEQNSTDLNAKQQKQLINPTTWENQLTLLQKATQLLNTIGTNPHSNFNAFETLLNNTIKQLDLKLSNTEKTQIINAITHYDPTAEKVVKNIQTFSKDKLQQLLQHLNCTEAQLPDFGYYPSNNKTNEYITYKSQSDLRDTEKVPLLQNIHAYFCQEVKPYADEAWIDLEKTKIGAEISFNQYFYQHKKLPDLTTIAAQIKALEKENDGLISDILKLYQI